MISSLTTCLCSVWRPLRRVGSWPLAVCDARTVRNSDLVSSDLVRRRYVGEAYFATYSERHKWYYLADQDRDEVVMIKIYDSSSHAEAKCTDEYPEACAA